MDVGLKSGVQIGLGIPAVRTHLSGFYGRPNVRRSLRKVTHYSVNAELRIPAAANVGRLYELGSLPAACTGPFLGPTRVSNHMEETYNVLKCIGLGDAVSGGQGG